MEFGSTCKSVNHSVERPDLHIPNLRGPSTPPPVSTKMSLPDLPIGWQIYKSLGRSMLTMYDSGLWTDITFRCKDQSTENLDERIRAHKIVLAARSPVFQAMFFGPCQDGNECIEMKDVESNLFERFMRTLYSDDFDLYEEYDDILDILELAHMYQIEEAVTGCCHKLGGMVSITNACQLLDVALLYENESLRDRIADFIDQNAEEVLKADGFLELSLDGLYHVLKGNTFYANEVNIFNRAEAWAKQRCRSDDGQTIRKTLGKAFLCLRTPAMTVTDFLFCTKTKGYFSMKEHEDILEIIVSDQSSRKQNNVQSALKFPRIPYQFSVTGPMEITKSMSKVDAKGVVTAIIQLDPHVDIVLTDITMKNFKHIFRIHSGKFAKHRVKDLYLEVSISIQEHKSTSVVRYGMGAPTIHLESPVPLAVGYIYLLKATINLGIIENLVLWPAKLKGLGAFTGYENIISVHYDDEEYMHQSTMIIKSLTFKGKDQRYSSIQTDLK